MSETSRNRTGRQTSSGRTSGASRTTRTTSSRQTNAERIHAVQNARNLGSSGSGTGSRRTSSSTRKRGRRRHQGPDFAKLLLILIGVVILLLCVAVGFRSCAKKADSEAETEESTEPESEIDAEITVNGVSINGLTKTEAKEKILEAIGWDIQVAFDGETKPIANMMEGKVDQVLEEAYAKSEAAAYTVNSDGLEDHVRTQVDTISAAWDVEPKNGSISSYDSASGEFLFTGAQNGKLIDRDKLTSDIMAAISAGEYKKTITASATEVKPEITEAEAKANFKRLGTFTTTTTSNKDRNENIRIASAALNGIIIQPGEEFSFNQTTGNRTTDKGYRPAGAYQNGVLVEEPGGGVCQVSSTLYNAVVFAGLKTTERHAHSYEPSYVTPGEDAMVSYDGYSGPDMKFVNNSKTAVGIKTSFSNQKLTISIYGNPILEEGVTLSMVSTKTSELDPPTPEYVEDPYLEIGVEQEVKAATPGSRWVTNLVTKKDGAVVSDVLLHTSTYSGKPATIKRNTSGTVLTSEGESSSEESSSTSETETAGEQPSVEPSQPQPGHPGGPGYETSSETSAQPGGPGDVIQPSESAGGGPGGSGGPGGDSGVVTVPQTEQQTGGPGQSADNSGPGEMGFISPIQ